jgi:hypothetical protein
MTTITIPERNRAIKDLLKKTYHGAKISVRGGTGTAYHWVHIEFLSMPEELKPCANGVERHKHVEAVIDGAGIYIHTYTSDGDYQGRCIEISVRGHRI